MASLSGDPHVLYGEYGETGPRNAAGGTGAIRAFGDHKGSASPSCARCLAGALTGGGTSGPVGERGRIANGMLSIYLSPAHFGDKAAFEAASRDYIAWVKSCRPAVEAEPVLVPGEMENTRRAERRVSGVPLTEETWQSLLDTATSLGIPAP
jgi:uncharacterized oxidoreductase